MAKQNNHCQWLHANRLLSRRVCEQCRGVFTFLMSSPPDRWCLLPKENCTFMAVRFTLFFCCTSLRPNHKKCLSMHLLLLLLWNGLPAFSSFCLNVVQTYYLNSSTNTILQSKVEHLENFLLLKISYVPSSTPLRFNERKSLASSAFLISE